MHQFGTMHGMRLMVVGGPDGVIHSYEDLATYLRRFRVHDVLRECGVASHALLKEKDTLVAEGGVPITNGALAFIALTAIRKGNDHRRLEFGRVELLKAIAMYHSIIDPLHAATEANGLQAAGNEYLLRLGLKQFEFQRETRNVLPRTVLLLERVWKEEPLASGIQIDADLKTLTGLSLEELLVGGFVMLSQGKKGFVFEHEVATATSRKSDRPALFPPDTREKFVNWASADYGKIRKLSGAQQPPSVEHETGRWNPIFTHPLVRPQVQPRRDRKPCLCVPIPRLVFERVTRGLYHDLAEHHRGARGANPFRSAFGYVFQRYVGWLLEGARVGRLVPEREYYQGRVTPDWMVVEGRLGVCIEVKQSGLFLPSKLWGLTDSVVDDLRKTIGHGIAQLASFAADFQAGLCALDDLQGVESLEHLVVTHDRVFFANSVIPRLLAGQGASALPPGLQPHVISIEELEYLLAYAAPGGLGRLLQEKRASRESFEMDFKEWMTSRPEPPGGHRNRPLDEVREAIFGRWSDQAGEPVSE